MKRGAPTPVIGTMQFTTTAGNRAQVNMLFTLHALEAVYSFSQSPLATEASKKFPFDWSPLFSICRAGCQRDARVRNFVEHRLCVTFPTSAARRARANRFLL